MAFSKYFWLFLLFWVKSSMQTRQLLDICSWCATSKGNYLTSMTYLSRKINLFFPRLQTINFRAKMLSKKFRQTTICYLIKLTLETDFIAKIIQDSKLCNIHVVFLKIVSKTVLFFDLRKKLRFVMS